MGLNAVVTRGFSLAEIMVVLAITAALTAIATPSLLSYWDGASVGAGARELATVMNLGRQLAISRRTTVCVDVTGTNVRLRLGGCNGTVWTGAVTDAAGTVRLSDPATLAISSNARVTFTALGAATPSATYTVTHARTRASRAVVVAASGRISIE